MIVRATSSATATAAVPEPGLAASQLATSIDALDPSAALVAQACDAEMADGLRTPLTPALMAMAKKATSWCLDAVAGTVHEVDSTARHRRLATSGTFASAVTARIADLQNLTTRPISGQLRLLV